MAKREIGLFGATALVAGNMIGSGIFMLPSAMAVYGGYHIFGWLFTGAGAILLAIVFGRLSRLIPKSGGPYTYAREGFGEFIGFQMAFFYWISIWTGNVAIVTSVIGSLSAFFPVLA